MVQPIAGVLNDTSSSGKIASQPEDPIPSPAAHLLHNSQEQNPAPFARAEVVAGPSFRTPPAHAKANLLPAFDVGDGIDGIFDETCGLGYSADADAFGKGFGTTGPGVEVGEGFEAAGEIAANTVERSHFPATQPTKIDRFTNHNTASQPEVASPSPAAHLLHNSQEQGPRPFASAEVVVGPASPCKPEERVFARLFATIVPIDQRQATRCDDNGGERRIKY